MGQKKPGSRADRQEKLAEKNPYKTGAPGRPITSETPKQIRARARRHGKIVEGELAKLYKPLDEWDLEELARGRPRAADGTFKGRTPSYISREVHEKAMERFKDLITGEMRAHTVTALTVVAQILEEDELDDKGRPVVPASTKLDAAKFLIEHLVGKPKQPIEADISVKLQAILGTAMVSPGDEGYKPASPSAARALGTSVDEGIIDAEILEEDVDVRR